MEDLYHLSFSSDLEANVPVFVDESSLPYHHHVSTSSSAFQFYGFPSVSVPVEEDKAIAASKSHSQAEKRRRDRINAQLSTLRKLIPMSDKMDKAALLGSVIDHVKDLKRQAAKATETLIVPTEVDEIVIDSDLSDQETILLAKYDPKPNDNTCYIRASLCCDDRPELFAELDRVIEGLRLTAVRADVASVSGRVKSVLVLCSKSGGAQDRRACVSALRQSLKVVLSRIASQSAVSSCRARSKRQRFFLPPHCSENQ